MTDFTGLWVFFQRHRRWALPVLMGLLLFVAGWQTGRMMSPYYAAHPIVFEDRQCTDCASSGGSPQELTTLREEGVSEQQIVQQTPQPTVAAATQQTGSFVGSVNSNKYHHPDCSSAKQIKPENQIWFSSTAEAEAAGYEPSQCTVQRLGL